MDKLIKIPQRQDCGLKISEGNSGETSINLSSDIANALWNDIEQGEEKPLQLQLLKEDFIKALCFIIKNLPLYKSSSKSYEVLEYTDDLFFSYLKTIEDFFSASSEQNNIAYYHPILFHRNDGRDYFVL